MQGSVVIVPAHIASRLAPTVDLQWPKILCTPKKPVGASLLAMASLQNLSRT
jgi:hypothetical protein